jgi:DNA repair exonuclease SbcCD ATPase subunit
VSVTELSTLITALVGLLAGVGLPIYTNYRKSRVTVGGVMQMIVEERNRLQERLDRMEAERAEQLASLKQEYERMMAEAEAKWRAQHEHDQNQISQLREEIDALYRRLYRPPADPVVQ